MAKTKISEFSSTPANNTDIDSINIAEGCAPSGINDAIRELMAQLKDFQTGAVGDSFNGPVGTSTAAAGAFTTLSASSTVSGTGFSTYLASPPAIGGTAAAAVSATTLAASGAVTLSGGTANGVTYLNGSKVLTSGSALVFDGTSLGVGTTSPTTRLHIAGATTATSQLTTQHTGSAITTVFGCDGGIDAGAVYVTTNHPLAFKTNNTERARIDSGGRLLVGLTSANTSGSNFQVSSGITFPATQSASSDANTLDDYEEGTFTPSFFGTTTQGTPTQTQQKGFYTKIGRAVSIMVYINMTNKGGMAGNLQISGLPFTALNVSGAAGAFAISEHGGLTAASSRTYFGLEQQTNATNITVYSNGSGVDASQQSIANTADASYIIFAGTYFSN